MQVSGLTNVTGVAAGDAHSLAVESDGTVWGWGSNNSGQIGAGLAVTRYTPVQLAGITTATAVAAGSAHSLARLADGTVRAWGDNSKGQLGDGTTNGSTTPVTVLGLQGVDKIAARANGSLARPTQANEQYAYDADGTRVTRSTGGVTWLSLGGGLWEERLGASAAGPGGWVVRQVYLLQGRAVAQQEDTPSAINSPSGRVFLHGDHLGSVSVVTDNDRRVLSRQDDTPWGEVRAGGVAQTTLDFTGQRRDGTGLLYYGARYYDPQTGRFISPDTQGAQQQNPQSLNRYSYVLDNPLNNTDPTGHEALKAALTRSPVHVDLDPGGGGSSPAQMCVTTLTCSVDTINAMSWDERIAWLMKLDAMYSLGGWFNNVLGILEYFRDSPSFHDSVRMMFEDAHVLIVIQDGLRGALGRLNPGETLGRAATLWQDFFAGQQSGADDSTLLPRWGRAEQAGVDEAGQEAIARGLTYSRSQQSVYDTFVTFGNLYRTAATNRWPLFVNPLGLNQSQSPVWIPDPRADRNTVRNLAFATEFAILGGCGENPRDC